MVVAYVQFIDEGSTGFTLDSNELEASLGKPNVQDEKWLM